MTKRYYLYVLGCQMNYSDAERIAAILKNAGLKQAEKENEADLIMVMACSVRQSALDRIWGKIRSWHKIKKDKPLVTVITGCILPRDKKRFERIFDLVFDIRRISRSPNLLINELGKLGLARRKTVLPEYFNILPSYQSKFSAYVPISTGCNNFCTYCAVPYTRGQEKSRRPEKIIKEIQGLIKKGYKRITLLGQNVNSYGHDFKNSRISFAGLLKKVDGLKGDFWFYFLTSHPKDMSHELIMVLPRLKKFGHYIHLPFQSGDNEILIKMNRHYTREHYLTLINKIRRTLPDVNLSTDIIVGFPGESKKQFSRSAKLLKKGCFDQAYIAQYSPRPDTAAFRLKDDIPKPEKVRRDKALNKILKKTAYQNNKKLLGQTVPMLVEKYDKGLNFGQSKNFKKLCFWGMDLRGKFVKVMITKATPWSLAGTLIK